MPELPEVETIVRTLAPQVEGQRITEVTVLMQRSLQSGNELLSLLVGGVITKAHRRAKLLLLDVCAADGSDLVLAFHLKMTGRFFVHPPGTSPLKHTRLIVDLGPGGRLFFDDMRSFGWCRIMPAALLNSWPFWATLGPEPLECGESELAEHLARQLTGKKRNIKACLLDQTIIAGIGNIYADEGLFCAGIAPQRRAGDLQQVELQALAEAVQNILSRAIQECGSSIRDYRDALGNAGAFQNSFGVYGRKGKSCHICGSALKDGRVAGRGTVWCPVCQQ
ncbi:bifunctional DNA-formamidopyrimidine glycosylase/DNA-(apurinic or apyrimidinic site) lyase [Desulfovibrio sp. OttesenSCG-928-M14]|nr:bifunctional DNA-formamidopyrimidine glycosylase/DNA-(apurinic or apyrimidinic site) lyase [Desulfovibrio sp. OttesenSCG-928-M14]